MSRIGQYPSETGLCSWIMSFSFGVVARGWWFRDLSLFSVPVPKSFWHLASFLFSPFSTSAVASSSFTPHSYFFLTLPFPQDPAFYPFASQTAQCPPEPSLPALIPRALLPRPLDRALLCHQVRHTTVTASC